MRDDYLARLEGPPSGHLDSVENWKAAIRIKQCSNPEWMTEWLEDYGPRVLLLLSDAQLAALLGVPLDRLRGDSLRQSDLRRLVAVKTKPIDFFFSLKENRKPDRDALVRFLNRRRHKICNFFPTWVDYQPKQKSPLRKVCTIDYSVCAAQNSPTSPQPMTAEEARDDLGMIATTTQSAPAEQEGVGVNNVPGSLDFLDFFDFDAAAEQGVPMDGISSNTSAASATSDNLLIGQENDPTSRDHEQSMLLDDDRTASDPLARGIQPAYAENSGEESNPDLRLAEPTQTPLANPINSAARVYDDSEYQQEKAQMSLPTQEMAGAASRSALKRRNREEHEDQPAARRSWLDLEDDKDEEVSTLQGNNENICLGQLDGSFDEMPPKRNRQR
jgi:hypothetical protein